MVYVNNDKAAGSAAYYEARHYLGQLGEAFGHEFEFVPLSNHLASADAPFALNRSAIIRIKGTEEGFGIVGEFNPSVIRALKLPAKTAGFELAVSALFPSEGSEKYTPLARFPKVTQDITLRVANDKSFSAVFDALSSGLQAAKPAELTIDVEALGIYQAPDDTSSKNLTFRVQTVNYEKTLTDAEINSLLEAAAASAAKSVGAERV
jgi:phenylalanyl-tRNA synthetase beta chain